MILNKSYECFTWEETFAICSGRHIGSLAEGLERGKKKPKHWGFHRKADRIASAHKSSVILGHKKKHYSLYSDYGLFMLHLEFKWYFTLTKKQSCGDKGSWYESCHSGTDVANVCGRFSRHGQMAAVQESQREHPAQHPLQATRRRRQTGKCSSGRAQLLSYY